MNRLNSIISYTIAFGILISIIKFTWPLILVLTGITTIVALVIFLMAIILYFVTQADTQYKRVGKKMGNRPSLVHGVGLFRHNKKIEE